MSHTSRERARRFKENMARKGFKRLELWLPPSLHSVVREFVEKLMKEQEDDES